MINERPEAELAIIAAKSLRNLERYTSRWRVQAMVDRRRDE